MEQEQFKENNLIEKKYKKAKRRYVFLFSMRGFLASLIVSYVNFILYGINVDTLLFSNICTPIFILVFLIYSLIICKLAKNNDDIKNKIINYKKKNKKDKE